MLWTVALVATPTFICGVWLNLITREAFTRSHVRSVEVLTQTVAATLAGRSMAPWGSDANAVIDALTFDPRVGLIIATDPEETITHRRVIDPEAYTAFIAHIDSGDTGDLEIGQPLRLNRDGSLIVRKVPIWNPPVRDAAAAGDLREADRQLEGFIILALYDRSIPGFLDTLQTAQIGATCVVILLMTPLVVIAVRRWVRPIRELLRATAQLARGRRPNPVPTATRDELGQLAEGFNDMAEKLYDARRGLEAANQELEEKVRARTAELEELTHRLQHEIDDKNEFLRAVSHDLGAPLRNINGMATMLLMKYKADLADDALNKLERISANAKLQTELIGDLLDLSKIRTRPGRKENIDLDQLIDELRQSFAYDLERSQIALHVERGLPVIYAERNRIRQVFQNLVDNAIKYMLDARERRVSVRSWRDDVSYWFEVADTGRGIAEQDLGKIFQVFRRSTHSGSHEVQGKGVGLASVKSIIEAYGGTIRVSSTLGQGSAFCFSLDIQAVTAPQIKRPAKA